MKLFRTASLIAAALAMMTWHQAFAQISADEREALIALYDSTNGQNWFNSNEWLGPEGTECDWRGISCLDGTVIAIHLRNNALSGSLPEALTALESLRFLSLQQNNIQGGVPAWLGEMPSLEAVDLNYNSLGGELPAAVLESSSLEKLWLKSAGLSGTLPEITSADSALQGLWLGYNDLTGSMPDSFGQLTQLRYLWLNDNQLSGTLPSSLSQLQNLQELGVPRNLLENTLPAALGTLPELWFIDASSNRLDGNLATWLGQAGELASQAPFPALVVLHLDFNDLSGPYPESLANLPMLRSLRLLSNQLSGTLPERMGPMWPAGENPSFPLFIDLRSNTGLTGFFSDEVVEFMLLGEMDVWFSGTNLDFGECWGLRQVATLMPPVAYEPGEPVEVSVYIRSRTMPGYPWVEDTIPEHWQVIDNPTCYCTTENPHGIQSAVAPSFYNSILRYQIMGPSDLQQAAEGSFSGQLVPALVGHGSRLICGQDRGWNWTDSIFTDRFF